MAAKQVFLDPGSLEHSFMINEKNRIKTLFQDHEFLKECNKNEKCAKSCQKNSIYSQIFRKQANQLFLKSHHLGERDLVKTWELYSRSVATAPSLSDDLIEAYYDRANFLYHLKKYSKCIDDFNKALDIPTVNDTLKMKLLCRKSEVLAKEGNSHLEKFIDDTVLMMKNFNLGEDIKNYFHTKLMETKNVDKDIPNNKISELLSDLKNYNFKVDFQKRIPCASTALDLKYSTNFGRHVVSTRKIIPGEILATEKLYSVMVTKIYSHCSHCGALAWASIPCENCVYAMYCSLDCKNQAWNEYHNFECQIIGNMWNENDETETYRIMLSMKLVLKAAKEHNCNISKLKSTLEEIDKNKDSCDRGFSKNGILESSKCQSVLSLVTNAEKKSNAALKEISEKSARATYCLIKKTSLFGSIADGDNFESNLLKDGSLFIGALISRMYHAILVNQFCLETEVGTDLKIDGRNMLENYTLDLGSAIAPFCSFINHSCCPNVATMITEKGEIILYAVQSIEENEQICICYGSLCYHTNQFCRKLHLSMIFIDCNCIACKEQWPTIERAPTLLKMKADKKLIKKIQKALMRKDGSTLNEDYLHLIAECIAEIMKKSLFPSYEFYELLNKLHRIHSVFYGKWLNLPDSCN